MKETRNHLEGVLCGLEGCGRPAERYSLKAEMPLCSGHRRRMTPARSGRLDPSTPIPPKLSPREKLYEAVYALADVDGDDDAAFERAQKRLESAAFAFVRAHEAASAHGSIHIRPTPPGVVRLHPRKGRAA